jgi:hypothetical protein
MSKKRGEAKMIDVDLTENIEPDYTGFAALGKRAAQDRVNVVSNPKWEKLLKPDTEPTLDTIIDNEVQAIRSDKENRILTALAQPRPR